MFRILEFTTIKHPLLGSKTFKLTNPLEVNTPNYFSLIIGPNGTGKSFLLSNLIEALNELQLAKTRSYTPKKKFKLLYKINQSTYFISTEFRPLQCEKEGRPIDVSELELPQKWLASSVTINDKYPILNNIRKIQNTKYEYLGIRSASNNAFISRVMANTVLYLIEALRKQKTESLLSVYKSLSLSPLINLNFIGGPMLKLEKREGRYSIYRNASKIVEPHVKFLKKYKSNTNYRVSNYTKHIENPETIDLVYSFLTKNQSVFEKTTKVSMRLFYEIDLSNNHGVKHLLEDWSILSVMLDLELIKISKISLTKKESFDYEEASSGEAHLLTSLHGIIAKLENDSLLVIDEPEISLHPNWQIDYFDILKSVVDNYTGVNVVISSHSHLIVSSLKDEESRITALKQDKDSGDIIVEEMDYETYGWEPERILYKIFGLVTQRNNYFENDVRSLLKLLSVPDSNMNDITRLRNNLAKYILSNQDDPLKIVISKADDYLSKRNA